MGLRIGFSDNVSNNGCCDGGYRLSGNPNPRRFAIKAATQIGRYVVAKIHYPDCTNYGGDKVCVFRDATAGQIESLSVIDPHFFEGDRPDVPVARFKPDDDGLRMAVTFCEMMTAIEQGAMPNE
jgi:hypothetical protein